MEYIRSRLGAKLLLSYLAVILAGALALAVASQFSLRASFNRHMGGMMSGGAGMMTSGPGRGPQLYRDFRAGFNEALIYAALAAVTVGAGLGWFFSRNVTATLGAMSRATQRIAEGSYEERVKVEGRDELAQLAARFNQMTEKLEQVEAMRRRLIGDVSHELRTPLTVIKGSMEGLMDGVLPATRETYQQIHAETDRLNRLVDDLQELSRVEANAYKLEVGAADAASLAQTVYKRLLPQFQARGVSLELDLARDLPPVLADEDRAVQALTNLAGNALQYTPEGGRCVVSARRVNDQVHISVRDTGIGIPAEHLPHIFDRFYRADKSRLRRAGVGSGIGLTIARALVEAQGGRIWAESAGEGQGSVFTFTLPIAK